MRRPFLPLACLFLAAGAGASLAACGPPGGRGVNTPQRTPVVQEWFDRAQKSYKAGDFEDAHDAIKHALDGSPHDPELRLVAARVALTKCDFAEAIKLTEGLDGTEAHSIRGRARWYSGDVDQAADELEAMLDDPKVRDPWARDVARLARAGSGRHPFQMDGGIVALVEMPRGIGEIPVGEALVVPVEIEGEPVLAMVATGVSEVMLDANTRKDPTWISMRFAGRIEVKDVPALTQDLSPLSHEMGFPIKALIGSNFLRHAHVTFDRHGDQFIVRNFEPGPPPDGTRIPLFYLRGGGMTLRAGLTQRTGGEAPFLVDTARFTPATPQLLELAVSEPLWKQAGADMSTLVEIPKSGGVKRGLLPTFRFGGFDLAKQPALRGYDMSDVQSSVDVDLGGIVGATMLSWFRVSFADEGRYMWIEPDPTLVGPPAPPPQGPEPATPPPMTPDQDVDGGAQPSQLAPPLPTASSAEPARPLPPENPRP